MNEAKKQAIRCTKFQNHKNLCLNTKEGTKRIEDIMHKSGFKANKKNDNSPQSFLDCSVSTHSTPIRKKYSDKDVEESPNLDYYSSPILLPCTQEGGNEVAWDWQSSLSKTPDSRSKKQSLQCETPKGTKLLQRKRNSNSPLLYKPLKRKTIKMENIENIGQFAAELQALSERMKIIKQNNKRHLDDDVTEDTMTIATISNDKGMLKIKDNQQNYSEKPNDHKTGTSASYDDLFDDSIDDSMARCTQEIEEKFNLILDKEITTTVYSQAKSKREERFHTNNTTNRNSPIQSTSIKKCRTFLTKGFFPDNTEDNNVLRTYSRISSKKDTKCNALIQKDQHESYLNNNMVHSHIGKSYNNRKSSKKCAMELFDIPDDSFDDCLATCIEDEKLLSASTESDDSSTHKNDTKAEASCKILIPLKKGTSCNNPKLDIKSPNFVKSAIKVEACNNTFLENRKFFKTKSLSDQYINQDTITYAKNISNASASGYMTKSALYLNSFSKNFIIPHKNVVCTSVNTNTIVTNERELEDNGYARTFNTGSTYGSDVNRFAVKEGDNRFIKYNSTGNIKSEIRKTGLQLIPCTAEEIERKRLQAKVRLEARKKLYPMKTMNNIMNR